MTEQIPLHPWVAALLMASIHGSLCREACISTGGQVIPLAAEDLTAMGTAKVLNAGAN